MSAVVGWGFVALMLFYTARLTVQAFVRSEPLAARSRLGVLVAGAEAVLVLVLAHALVPWSTVPTVLWLAAVALMATGAGGAVLRWRSLPRYRPGGRERRQRVGAVLTLVLTGVVLVGALLL